MIQREALLSAVALLAVAAWLAAAEQPVGSWDCVSSTPVGTEMKWTLHLKEEQGQLVGTAESDEGSIPISEVHYDNGTLSFRVSLETGVYIVTLKFNGNKVAGDWKSESSGDTGTVKGVKRA